jgi:murein DD-endopeptidase MepM/ murein hydrolase activator NlpD
MRLRVISLAVVALLLAAGPASAQAPPDLAIPDGAVEEMVFPQPELHTEFENDWGYERPDGRVHMGNDLVGEKGDPVVSVLGGVVLRMRSGPNSGYYVVIQHDNGWTSWYLHLNNDRRRDDGRGGAVTAFAPGLAVGQRVDAGQLIGFVGDSGNAEGTAPHTHFELHIDGRTVDPYPYLLAAWERHLESLDQQRIETFFARGAS